MAGYTNKELANNFYIVKRALNEAKDVPMVKKFIENFGYNLPGAYSIEYSLRNVQGLSRIGSANVKILEDILLNGVNSAIENCLRENKASRARIGRVDHKALRKGGKIPLTLDILQGFKIDKIRAREDKKPKAL